MTPALCAASAIACLALALLGRAHDWSPLGLVLAGWAVGGATVAAILYRLGQDT